MLVQALKTLGPCLSTDLAAYLVDNHGLSPAAARQRISRAPPGVKRLGHLPFPRRARFIYLEDSFASFLYWENLYKAIHDLGGPYSRALNAVLARGVVPVEHFRGACGSPISQKKQISADAALERLIKANVLVKASVGGLGECVMTKQMSELIFRGVNQTVNETRSRLIAEEILLEYIKDWSRRLGMVSYGSVKTRESKGKELPRVGTFAWDFTAPSYISGLSDWANGAIKPGFFVCDLLLKDQVSQQDIEPFVNKIKTLKALRKIGRQFPVFVAGSYQLDAFKLLRENGVIPATVENLFGKETAESFKELMKVLMKAAEGVLNPEKLDELIGRLGKVEGAVRNMRGALFEFLVAEVIRKESPAEVEVSKILKAKSGSAEVDVWELKSGVVARAIECKGINPSGYVDEKEIDVWLRKRIIRVREYLDSIGWNGPKPRFELWTSGRLTDDSLERIKNTREANKNKFEIVAFDSMSVFGKIRKYNDKSLMAVYANNYCDAW